VITVRLTTEKWPFFHSCTNQLDLPRYPSRAALKSSLAEALANGGAGGFSEFAHIGAATGGAGGPGGGGEDSSAVGSPLAGGGGLAGALARSMGLRQPMGAGHLGHLGSLLEALGGGDDALMSAILGGGLRRPNGGDSISEGLREVALFSTQAPQKYYLYRVFLSIFSFAVSIF